MTPEDRPPPTWAAIGVLLALVALLLRLLANVRGIDLDLFHEMALARELFQTGSFPRDDVFAYVPTVSPTVHHEWGTGVVLYLLTDVLGGGLAALALLRLVLLGLIGWCSIQVARRRGATGVEVVVLAPLAILLFWTGLSPVRAHFFTFAFLALLLWFLEEDRVGRRWWLLAWPVLVVLWLNLHAGFVVGAGMLGLYTLEALLRTSREEGWDGAIRAHLHLVAATAIVPLLVVVNPYGFGYIPYLLHALFMDRPIIIEWRSLFVGDNLVEVFPFWLATVLIAAYAWLRATPEARRMPALLLLGVAALVALRSIRILPIYMVVWLAYVPPLLATTPLAALLRRTWMRHARPLGAALGLAGVVGIGVALARGAPWVEVPVDPEGRNPYPAGAVAYLADEAFEGNVMTPFGVGAYVSWYLHPRVRVGLDSRYEVAYPTEWVEEMVGVYGGEAGDADRWREYLERHPTDLLLVRPGTLFHEQVEAYIEGSPAPAWEVLYQDDAYTLFRREGRAQALPLLDRRGEPLTPLPFPRP